ncbi:MAG: molybdenum cofactor guanylyltransferase [Bacteroidales bacterium]|jgi:molybdopterin-guanine dinucleotide biosynthesis protein A|nr:molybdenum cofactor guanylyltransferase [Bacteroidales bacterium]
MMTGIILAGGRSSRMGHDKGLISFHGKLLVQYSIDVFEKLCREILISSNNLEYEQFGYPVIPDVTGEIGPMGGLYSGLLKSTNKINLVLSCDMPFVTGNIFQRLIYRAGTAQVCIPYYGQEKYEPLCGLYRKNILETMTRSLFEEKNYKLPDLFSRVETRLLLISEIDPPLPEIYFKSINSPEDLAL